jgi:hypothetical protein
MPNSHRRRIVPLVLGLGMLAVVVAAGLSPNTGVVAAASNCTYGQCPSSGNSVPTWEIATIGAVIVLALLAGLFILMRRRRRPPTTAAPAGGQGPTPPVGAAAPPSNGPEEMAGPASAIPAATYVETPEDVGSAPPTLGTPPGAPAAAGAKAEAEPDIDSLMAELDKISGEILKRTPKKAAGPPGEEAGAEESPPE